MSHTSSSLPPSLLSLLEGGEEPPQQTMLMVVQLWEQFRETTFTRIGGLERAVLALGEGPLREELREQAERDAHKLAGSVGMFGFVEGSRLARVIEQMLQAGVLLGQAETLRLSELVVLLRRELEQPSPVQLEGEALPDPEPPFCW